MSWREVSVRDEREEFVRPVDSYEVIGAKAVPGRTRGFESWNRRSSDATAIFCHQLLLATAKLLVLQRRTPDGCHGKHQYCWVPAPRGLAQNHINVERS
jgi:hypothetical protein